VTHNASLSRYGKPYVTIAQAKECLRKAGYIITKPRALRLPEGSQRAQKATTILPQRIIPS
jgi:hypothetical protein